MSQSQYRARQVGAKTHEVVEYDRDDEKPGKPLHLLVPGGLIALAALGLIVYIAYQTWFEGSMPQGTGLLLIGILSPFYVGGVFLFSYGYELYNLPRALRLTAIIVFITLASVVIVAVLFFVAGESKGGSKSSSRSSSGSSKSASPSKVSSMGTGIFIGGLGGPARVETREVTREVVKEVPREPMPITCPFCGRSYTPAQNNFICPSCGAAAPRDLIEDSQEPKLEV
jgi:hypothetical protein